MCFCRRLYVLSGVLITWQFVLWAGAETIDLSQERWTFRSRDGSLRGTAIVPGDIYQDLFNSGIIPEPLFGNNDQELRWIAATDWIYECSFTIPRDWKKVNRREYFHQRLPQATFFMFYSLVAQSENNMEGSMAVQSCMLKRNTFESGLRIVEMRFSNAPRVGEAAQRA